jgi:hypothetical protein
MEAIYSSKMSVDFHWTALKRKHAMKKVNARKADCTFLLPHEELWIVAISMFIFEKPQHRKYKARQNTSGSCGWKEEWLARIGAFCGS